MGEQTMGWQSEEFGSAHEGTAGVLLADGTEPGPVYLDAGSGGNVSQTTAWQIYDGRLRRPKAVSLRGACSCSWRGVSSYPIEWAEIEDWPYDVTTTGPREDWARHIAEVEARSIPLPPALEDLLGQMGDQLGALLDDAPLAALKAVAALERIAQRVGHEAAYSVRADETPWEAIATALGLPEGDARGRLLTYSHAG
jgi:hypothetical protein